VHDDRMDEVPGWILPFFADRPPAELQAWWEAVKRLYGPLGVRMDFRAAAQTAAPVEVPLLAG
jgi:hypothetical protein